MAGLLSTMFDDSDPSGTDTSQSTYEAGGHGGLDLSESVPVSNHAEASWEDPDGTDHTYTSDTDVVLTVDASAAFAATGTLTGASMDEG